VNAVFVGLSGTQMGGQGDLPDAALGYPLHGNADRPIAKIAHKGHRLCVWCPYAKHRGTVLLCMRAEIMVGVIIRPLVEKIRSERILILRLRLLHAGTVLSARFVEPCLFITKFVTFAYINIYTIYSTTFSARNQENFAQFAEKLQMFSVLDVQDGLTGQMRTPVARIDWEKSAFVNKNHKTFIIMSNP
jgi:hypothetical protein